MTNEVGVILCSLVGKNLMHAVVHRTFEVTWVRARGGFQHIIRNTSEAKPIQPSMLAVFLH